MRLYYDSTTGDGLLTEQNLGDRPEPFIEISGYILDPRWYRVVGGQAVYIEDLHRAAWRDTAELDREGFAVAAWERAWITETEAEQWLAGNAIPAIAQTALDSIADPTARARAKISIFGQQYIRRKSTLILTIQTQQGISDADLDDAFGFEALPGQA